MGAADWAGRDAAAATAAVAAVCCSMIIYINIILYYIIAKKVICLLRKYDLSKKVSYSLENMTSPKKIIYLVRRYVFFVRKHERFE